MEGIRRDARTLQAGPDPLLKPSLLAQSSFSAGAVFAVVYFAGFTSVFFTLSILWQEGLGRSALMTGLVAVPFSFGSLASAAVSDKLSARLGRMVLVTGCAMVGAGLALTVLVIHLTAPLPGGGDLVGPLLLAGLGSGMVIAPNQDFVLARVPSQEAGTGSAIGIAVIGTMLFATLHVSSGPDAVAAAFSHSAQIACWPTWPSPSPPCCWWPPSRGGSPRAAKAGPAAVRSRASTAAAVVCRKSKSARHRKADHGQAEQLQAKCRDGHQRPGLNGLPAGPCHVSRPPGPGSYWGRGLPLVSGRKKQNTMPSR